jgi:drug/metabolite transporter (DMT)-like permease
MPASELRDLALGVPVCFAGLLCFALSFSLGKPDGRPVLFSILLAICLVCLALSRRRVQILSAIVVVICIRVVWALLLHSWRTH